MIGSFDVLVVNINTFCLVGPFSMVPLEVIMLNVTGTKTLANFLLSSCMCKTCLRGRKAKTKYMTEVSCILILLILFLCFLMNSSQILDFT